MKKFFITQKDSIFSVYFAFLCKCKAFFIIVLMLIHVAVFAQTIDRGNYFIAESHDGNTHDLDDIVASPMAIAIYGEQGLWDKVLHFQYNDNLGGDRNSAQMKASVDGAIKNWNLDGSKVFNIQSMQMIVSAAAKANFVKAAQTAKDKGAILYFICGGPMEAPYQVVSNLNAELRKVVHVISHSGWNDDFQRNPSSRVWTDLIKIAGGFTHISGQNGPYFNDPIPNWKWLDDKGGKYSWLFGRNPFTDKFDASDAGMAFWLITGKKNDQPTKEQVIKLFSGKISSITSTAQLNPKVTMYPNPTKNIVNFSEVIDAEIYNLTGQKVLSIKNSSKADVSALAVGIYQVKVKDDSSHKLVVK